MKLCARCQKRPTPSKRRKYCDPCQEIVEKENNVKSTAKGNAKAKAKRAELRAAKGFTCRCGCGREVRHPKFYHPDCKEAARRQRLDKQAERSRAKMAVYKGSGPKQLTPHTPTQGVLTDEEQARIDAEAREREAKYDRWRFRQLGLTFSPGRPLASEPRSLTREEIEALAAVYRPPSVEDGLHLKPWVLHGGGA